MYKWFLFCWVGLSLGVCCVGEIQSAAYKAVVRIQVLNQAQPLEGVQVKLSRSVSGRVADASWVGQTGADGWATVDVATKQGSVSGYYIALATDSLGNEIGRWHSIPLVSEQQSVVRLEVGKRFDGVETLPLQAFGVTLDSAMAEVDSVIAGVYLPLRVRVLSRRFENGLGTWEVDESYQEDGVRVSVSAWGQDVDRVQWRGDGVTDLGGGQGILNSAWKGGQRQIEVMSTRVLDNFSVNVQALDRRGRLGGLTVDEGDITQYIVRAFEGGVETTEVIGEFDIQVISADSWGNPSQKRYHGPDVDPLMPSLEMLDSRIQQSDLFTELLDLFVDISANMGDARGPRGPQALFVNGSQFTIVAPNREGAGLIVAVRTTSVHGDTTTHSRLERAIGFTPPLTFLPEISKSDSLGAINNVTSGVQTYFTQNVFIRSFGAKKGDLDYLAGADMNHDGVVGFADVLLYLKLLDRKK